jgi:hypothetical protein
MALTVKRFIQGMFVLIKAKARCPLLPGSLYQKGYEDLGVKG